MRHIVNSSDLMTMECALVLIVVYLVTVTKYRELVPVRIPSYCLCMW